MYINIFIILITKICSLILYILSAQIFSYYFMHRTLKPLTLSNAPHSIFVTL